MHGDKTQQTDIQLSDNQEENAGARYADGDTSNLDISPHQLIGSLI